ncbi:MAG: 4'-phosphopantetheinyl transferase superfamily protein [Muribaculaceae bacterium]|nr:4'-phosphopantetheinyl transferase superfamily protein [Muribaculaceae bacterium]
MITERKYGDVLVVMCALPQEGTRREAERAAVAALLEHVLPGAEMIHTAEGAPVIDGGPYISISHSRTHAALAVCAGAPVGIDIETQRAQLARVAPRVLSEAELDIYGRSPEGLLQAWTLKEALYKAALTPGLDFRRDIHLPLGDEKNEASVAAPGGSARCFAILAASDGLAVVRRQSLVP